MAGKKEGVGTKVRERERERDCKGGDTLVRKNWQ